MLGEISQSKGYIKSERASTGLLVREDSFREIESTGARRKSGVFSLVALYSAGAFTARGCRKGLLQWAPLAVRTEVSGRLETLSEWR